MLNGVQWYGAEAKADNATLPGAKIVDANLSGINLKQAHLDNVDFAGTILVGADLTGATATGATFTNAPLQGAKFSKDCILVGADFTNAAVALEHGVPLFGLDAGVADGYIRDLDAQLISADLKKTFQSKDYTLLDKPSVTVSTAGSQWTVSNATTAMPVTGLGSMYETFIILKTASGRLQFFGSMLWVTQVSGDELQSKAVLCLPSVLPDQSKMDDSMVFPSGHRLSEFTANEFTWEQMMTARVPLTPPKCIPSPGAFCPHIQPTS